MQKNVQALIQAAIKKGNRTDLSLTEQRQLMKALRPVLLIPLFFIGNLLFARPVFIEPDSIILRKNETQEQKSELYFTFINRYANRVQSPTALLHVAGMKNPIEAGFFALTEHGWRKGHPTLFGEKGAIIVPSDALNIKQLEHCTPIFATFEMQEGVFTQIFKAKRDEMNSKQLKRIRIEDSEFSSPCHYLDQKQK